MGCDIHLYTEKETVINGKKKWVNIDNWKLNPYYEEGNNDGETKYRIFSAYRNRDYTLFAILADVRNGNNNIPISQPKGLPEDVSDVTKAESDFWDSDGHSHSFFTMQELYSYYENNKLVNHSGLTDKKGVEAIEKGEMPDWWCGGSNNESLIYKKWTHENTNLKNLIEKLEDHFESEYYKKEEQADKFRIVFFFDN